MQRPTHVRRRSARTWAAACAGLTSIAAFGVAGEAQAATCVTLDAERDGLGSDDRQAAVTLFEGALAEQGLEIAREGCSETWVLYHVRLGKSLTVVVESPRGTRRERVKTVEDLPPVYHQLARAVLTNSEITSDGAAVDRRNVTSTQTEARRVSADAIWYAKLGYGVAPVPEVEAGPAFGFGRRWELDRVAIDLSFLNFVLYQDSDGIEGTSAGWVGLGAGYFFDPYANNTPYLSAGLVLGSHALPDPQGEWTGTGLEGKATLGYEFFRASTIRLSAALEARLPLYRLSREVYDAASTEYDRERTYVPVTSFSLGIGWGRSSR